MPKPSEQAAFGIYPQAGKRGQRKPTAKEQLAQIFSDERAMDLPKFGEVDLEVPSAANRAMSQRMVERDVDLKRQADRDMSPLEKIAGGMQTGRLIGSGLVNMAKSIPTAITKGGKAAEEYIAENIYKPTVPKAYEYAEDIGNFLQSLESDYKIPPIIPEAMMLQNVIGPATRQAGRAAQRGARQGALNLAAPRTLNPQAGVIKMKGGNWLGGSVEKALQPLKSPTTAGETPAQRIAKFEELLRDPSLTPQNIETATRLMNEEKQRAAIDNWVDRNLGNYIKKEMATPEDPVRKLADQGITHMPKDALQRGEWLSENMENIRRSEGFPGSGMASTDMGRGWENLADEAIQITAPIVANKEMLAANPWLSKLDPNQSVYRARPNDVHELGFDHIIDILRQDVASGRIRPEQLNKVSMEQAVRRTYEYDQEMAKRMRETALKQQEGFPVYKEYPEGYRWVELTTPKNMKLPEGYSVKPDPITNRKTGVVDTNSYRLVDKEGKIVGWGKTEEEAISSGLGEQVLKDALKYEGDTMGHCVGGYCPDVLEGRSRIFSLRDAKGEPHVTVEVEPNQYAPRHEDVKTYMLAAEEEAKKLPQGYTDADVYDIATRMAKENAPSRIKQIKGKQNAAPKEDYLPYVQDFVRSGQWADVGDLQNTGLFKLGDDYMTEAEAAAKYQPMTQEALNFLETHPAFEQHRIADKAYSKFKGDPFAPEYREVERAAGEPVSPSVPYTYRELRALLSSPEDWTDRNGTIYDPISRALEKLNQAKKELGIDLPPEDGMARGGRVHFSDNPDVMQLELAGGGLVKGLKAAAKAVKGTQDVLPAAEREANKAKFLESSKTPQVMYHGTSKDFSAFDRLASTKFRRPSMDTVGSWFSSVPEKAERYAGFENRLTMPVHLNIKNPKLYATFDDFLRDMHEAEGRDFSQQNPKGIGSAEGLREKLKAQGYDGIQFEQTDNESIYNEVMALQEAIKNARKEELSVNRLEREPFTMKRERLQKTLEAMNKEFQQMGGSTEFDGHDVFVAFEPEQIKSAIGNRGTYDITDPDITKADGGAVHMQAGGLAKALKAAKAAKEPAQAPMKASEALGRIEGRPLVITQSDRTKVGGGFLGGPGFSSLQLTEPEYRAAEAVWGVKTPGVAKMILGGGRKAGPDPVYTTFIGTPNQHQSNQMVFDKLLGDFKKSAKKGGLDPELKEKINYRLANAVDKDGRPIFPPDVDILDKNFRNLATTFDQRAVTSSLIGGLGVGGKKGQIIDYDKIIRNTTDPALLDAPSGALGNRLFTLSGGIIDRPDLHPAFPTILQGEDLGVSFEPVIRDLVMKDFIEKTMREKGRAPGYMDYTRGHPPSQLITEDILTEMQKLGKKAGGAVRKAEGGEITADDLILEERKL